MDSQLKEADKGARFFVLVGMWAESQTKTPKDVLEKELLTVLKIIKRKDPQEFSGLKKFLKKRGIEISF